MVYFSQQLSDIFNLAVSIPEIRRSVAKQLKCSKYPYQHQHIKYHNTNKTAAV